MKSIPYILCISEAIEYTHTILLEEMNGVPFEKHVFWAQETLPTQFWELLSLTQLFPKQRVLLIRHAEKITKPLLQDITHFLPTKDPYLYVVFSIETLTIPKHIKDSSLYTEAEKHAKIFTHTPLSRKTVGTYIEQFLAKQKISIERQALSILKESMPLAEIAIISELTKLCLASINNHITVEILHNAGSYAQEYTIWQLLTTIMNKKPLYPYWRSTIEQMSFFLLSAMIQKELRIFLCILTGDPIPLSPYVRTMKEQQARQYSIAKITKVFQLLADMEYSIKHGDIQEIQALEYTICTIQRII